MFPDGKRRLFPIDITINPGKENIDFNASGSLVLFMNDDELDSEHLDSYRAQFAKRITSIVQKERPPDAVDGFVSKFDEGEEERRKAA